MDAINVYFTFFFHAIVAFALVVIFIMPIRKFARLSGLVDKPGGRKAHDVAVPPVGGLVIFTVFLIFAYVTGYVDLQKYWPLYIGLIILLVSGAFDDQFHINAKLKFLIHVCAAGVIAFYGNVQAAYLGDLFGFGVIWTGFLSYPFTIIAIVLLINAMNLMDGMDGLAGGVSFVIFSWFIFAATGTKLGADAAVLVLLNACIAGFLVFNMRNPWRRRASLFLGDAGSMSLGLAIAWFGVHFARGPTSPIEPIVLAWIIGFPIFDTCAQFYRRACEGRDPFSPDRGHFHHLFIDAGVPVHYASPVIVCIVALMGGFAVGAHALGVPNVVLTVLWVVALLFHIFMIRKPDRYIRIIKHFSDRARSSR